MRPDQMRCSGFTYLGVLILVAVMGMVLAITGQIWKFSVQSAREKELLFIGGEFRDAIASYYESPPTGARKTFPASLADLLDDRRHQFVVKRHLRRIYRDPFTGGTEWGTVRLPDDTITGVFSLSALAPRQTAGFRGNNELFSGAQKYSDWKFVHEPPKAPANVARSPVAGMPPPSLPGNAPVPDGGREVSTATAPGPPSRCERIAQTDAIACQRVEDRFGPSSGGECVDSARARAAACAAGEALPALLIRYI
ncbi:MAG: hypothetical protein ACKVP2_03500 [Burkholderiales bacterium]